MFNRIFLIFVGVICLVTILYLGTDLVSNESNLSPQGIFNEKDKRITIINHFTQDELQDIPLEANPKIRNILLHLQSVSFNNYTIYFSSHLDKLIIQSKRHWNKELIKQFFLACNLELERSIFDFKTKFGYDVLFKNNTLFIGNLPKEFSNKSHFSWDKYANYSIINTNDSHKIEDVYLSDIGVVKYLSYRNNKLKGKKINDRNLFCDLLPSKISDYHFYEKTYAQTSNAVAFLTPLSDWCENGFVLFQYEGSACMVSDYKDGVDPFSILNDYTGEEELIDGIKTHYTGVKLTNIKGYTFEDEFYIEYLGDKIIVSDRKETLRQLTSDFELGNTLSTNKKMLTRIFEGLPTIVSERYVSYNLSYTKAVYQQKVNEVIKLKHSRNESLDEVETIDLNAKCNSLHVGNEYTYVITDNHILNALKFGNKKWSVKIEGDLIGEPIVLDVLNQGVDNILVTTSKNIYLFNSKGQLIKGFPIQVKSKPTLAATILSTKEGNKIFCVFKNNLVQKYSLNGDLEKQIKVDLELISKQIYTFNSDGETFGLVLNDHEGQRIGIDKLEKLNKFEGLSEDLVFCTSSDEPSFFYFDEDELIKNSFDGEIVKIGNFKKHSLLRVISGKSRTYITFLTGKELIILNEEGKIQTKIKFPSTGITNYSSQLLADGSVIVSLFDTLSNDIYIYTIKGKLLFNKPIEGLNKVAVFQDRDSYIVTTLGKQYVIQYRK